MLSNNGLCLHSMCIHVSIFITTGKFQLLQIYGVTRSYSSRPFLCALAIIILLNLGFNYIIHWLLYVGILHVCMATHTRTTTSRSMVCVHNLHTSIVGVICTPNSNYIRQNTCILQTGGRVAMRVRFDVPLKLMYLKNGMHDGQKISCNWLFIRKLGDIHC